MGSRKAILDNGGAGYADGAGVVVNHAALVGRCDVHPEGWRLDGHYRVHQVQMLSGGAGGSFTVRVWGPGGAWAPYEKAGRSSWAVGELLVLDDVVTEHVELTPTGTGDAATFSFESFAGCA